MPVADAHQLDPTRGDATRRAPGAPPWVLVAIDHPMMRALTSELLRQEGACRVTAMGGDDQALAAAIARGHPDLVILDTGEFPACCPASLRRFASGQVIVIGPEPGGHRNAALAAGAGAWISRDRVGEDLMAEVRRVMTDIPRPSPA